MLDRGEVDLSQGRIGAISAISELCPLFQAAAADQKCVPAAAK